MRLAATQLSFCLALAPALALVAGCGQKPAFTDQSSTRDSTNGQDGTDSGPGSANAQASTGGATGGTGTAPSGSDSTTGDFPGGDRGPGGATDSDSTSGGTGASTVGATDGGTGAGTAGATGGGTSGGTGGTTAGATGGHTGGSTAGTTGGSTSGSTTSAVKLTTTDQTFDATMTANGAVTKTLDTSTLTHEITMVRNYSAKAVTMNQVVRPPVTNTFTQGHAASSNTETFNQTANRPLDIVAVTDDSNSMGEVDATGVSKQLKVASKVMDLLSELGDTDWQIGVVTTDPNDTSLRGIIKKGDANPQTEFYNAWVAGTNGSDNERGILQSVRAMQGYNGAPTWIRPNSTVAVLIVSDEDNCSAADQAQGPGAHQNNCRPASTDPNQDYSKAPYLVNYLSSIRQLGKTARVYGIIWGPDQTQDQCPLGYNQSFEYPKAITATGGVWGSICAPDYSPILQKISADVQTVLVSNFNLMYVPDPTSVQVFVGTTQLTAGQFTVTGNVVSLATAPAVGATVTINYLYGAVPVFKTFPLSAAPFASSVAVTVNGAAAVLGTDYTVDPAAPAIDFAVDPADRAQVVVTYKQDVPLLTAFNLNDNIKPGTLTVTVNGVAATAGTDYTEQDPIGVVTFAAAPPEGAKVAFAYTEVGSAVYAYPFTTPSGAPGDLAAYDAQSMAPIAVSYVLGDVVVSPTDWQEGRQMMLRYDNVARNTFEVDLPQMPLAGTVKATDGATTCAQAPQLVVNGEVVDVSNCGFAFADNQVAVDYSYVTQQLQDFDFTAATLPAAGAYQAWTVWVNGVVSTAFTRTAAHFHFTAPLPLGAVVKIELIQAVN